MGSVFTSIMPRCSLFWKVITIIATPNMSAHTSQSSGSSRLVTGTRKSKHITLVTQTPGETSETNQRHRWVWSHPAQQTAQTGGNGQLNVWYLKILFFCDKNTGDIDIDVRTPNSRCMHPGHRAAVGLKQITQSIGISMKKKNDQKAIKNIQIKSPRPKVLHFIS